MSESKIRSLWWESDDDLEMEEYSAESAFGTGLS